MSLLSIFRVGIARAPSTFRLALLRGQLGQSPNALCGQLITKENCLLGHTTKLFVMIEPSARRNLPKRLPSCLGDR
jgi:hypothetical protein